MLLAGWEGFEGLIVGEGRRGKKGIVDSRILMSASSQMAMGTKNMFATTWSRARATKVAVGHQIAVILLTCCVMLCYV